MKKKPQILEITYNNCKIYNIYGTYYSQPWSSFVKRIKNMENISINDRAGAIGITRKELKDFENSRSFNLAIFDKVMKYYSRKDFFAFVATF